MSITPATPPVLASELYATSQGAKCSGPDFCHWCGAPCQRVWLHDDLPRMIGVRRKEIARRPGNSYVCVGCWLWRRKRMSITFLEGMIKDGQSPLNHSWVVTSDKALAIPDKGREVLYETLLNPPLVFSLSLLDGTGIENKLQCQMANNNPEVRADTELQFTLNNIEHAYSPYELKQALIHGPEGKEPGVQALVRFLGAPRVVPEAQERKRGRPRQDAVPNEVRKVLRGRQGQG